MRIRRLCQGSIPLGVVLQQPERRACFLERLVLHSLGRPGGANLPELREARTSPRLLARQEHPEVKSFLVAARVNPEHASYRVGTPPSTPPRALYVHVRLGHLHVPRRRVLASVATAPVQLKPLGELRRRRTRGDDIRHVGRRELRVLHILEVHRESDDVRRAVAHLEPEDAPRSLRRADASNVGEVCNLVDCNLPAAHHRAHHRSIASLVTVLEQVLTGLRRGRHDLHVDVRVVPQAEVGIVRHHPAVVELTRWSRTKRRLPRHVPALLRRPPPIGRVLRVLVPRRLRCELVREALRAGALLDAPILVAPMCHLLEDDVLESPGVRRNLGTDERVNLRGRGDLGVQHDENVRVRQPALLVLDDVDVRHRFAEDSILQDLRHQRVELDLEHPRRDVGTVLGREQVFPLGVLAHRVDLALDLVPLRVARDGHEQIGLPELSNDRHGVLVTLHHVSRATCECRRENHPPADVQRPFTVG